jgi:hypothetical protein
MLIRLMTPMRLERPLRGFLVRQLYLNSMVFRTLPAGVIGGTTLVGVFRRHQPAEPDAAPAEPDESPSYAEAQGKGRPTPKRKDAERTRKARVSPPKNRKEAARQTRERARAERNQRRQALLSGDPKALPARDRGPVRAFARDYVDRRRSAAELFIPVALVILVLGFIQTTAAQTASILLWLVMLVAMAFDSTILLYGLLRAAGRRFPEENRRGLWAYALTRSIQLRRLRLPRPRVKPGEPLPADHARSRPGGAGGS